MAELHQWVRTALGPWTACAKCGVISNSANTAKPCPGRVVVGPRTEVSR